MTAAYPADKEYLQEEVPAFQLALPARQSVPLIFSSPHSGQYLPPQFWSMTELSEPHLRQSEDRYVDELFACAPSYGAPLIKSVYSRVWLDLNREEYELDPAMFEDDLPEHINSRSSRVAGGLGTIARVVSRQTEIYRRKLTFAEASARLTSVYHPFHQALSGLVRKTRSAFGKVLLIDCHSMPETCGAGKRSEPQVVLGDRFGASCSTTVTDWIEANFRAAGYSVSRNTPYAGGFITQSNGQPDRNIHALQIEISRSLYMDQETLNRHDGMSKLSTDIDSIVGALAQNIERLI